MRAGEGGLLPDAHAPSHSRGAGGRRVTCRWRIRHKLILGLGLVVGILALLLAGTYKGLSSYHATTNSIGSKLVELQKAQQLKEALKSPDTTDPNEAWHNFQAAREKLDEYEVALNDTLVRHRDPENGYHEQGYVKALRGTLDELHQSIDKLKQPEASQRTSGPVVEYPEVKPVYQKLLRTVDELHGVHLQEPLQPN